MGSERKCCIYVPLKNAMNTILVLSIAKFLLYSWYFMEPWFETFWFFLIPCPLIIHIVTLSMVTYCFNE